ncbi:MAG TPA: hypothetical protein VD860_17015 [Azospirillum sp.]|nr:hypothetical protein [Azospirillum sp.]
MGGEGGKAKPSREGAVMVRDQPAETRTEKAEVAGKLASALRGWGKKR